MIIADSDVLVDYLRDRAPMAGRVALELQSRGFATTAITAAKLWVGARTPRQVAAVETLLAAMTVIPLDPDAARAGGEIRRDLVKRGEDIGMADCLIAGICVTQRGVLLTRNHKHFGRIPALKLTLARGEEP